jgi:virginiamycin B lyase
MKKALNATLIVLLFACVGYAAPGSVISGTVKGPDGAPFQAAMVRVQNLKTKMTMTVVSNNQGKYVTNNLPPGNYDVWTMSVGYSGSPARQTGVTVADGKNLTFDFTMKKRPVGWGELTKYQAGVLSPDGAGKINMVQGCFNCHAFSRIGSVGRNDENGWRDHINVMRAMGITDPRPAVENPVVAYLATAFGPDSTTPMSPADVPLYQKIKMEHEYFKPDALNVVYVDYDLESVRERPGVAHQDKQGFMWSEISGGVLRLDTTTGDVKEYHMDAPYTRAGIHDIAVMADGSIWGTLEGQAGLYKFDPRTEKFETYVDSDAVTKYNLNKPVQKDPNVPFPSMSAENLPGAGQNGAARAHTPIMDHDGNIWTSGRPLKKFDVETKKFTFLSADVPDSYGVTVDQKGMIWATELNSRDNQDLVMVDPKTMKVTHYKTPDAVSYRRVHVDSKGMIWAADYFGGNASRFDPNTKTFKVFKLPGAMPTPYGWGVDHNDNVWYMSMYSGTIGRLDPKTGRVYEYPSPYYDGGARDMDEDSQGGMWYGAQPYFKIGYARVRTDAEMHAAGN